MSDSEANSAEYFTVICRRCERPILAQRSWVGREVQCPHCESVLRVPPPAAAGHSARAGAPSVTPRRRFNFACDRCGCLLEAHTGMCGQAGRCPTCSARFTVPYLSPHTGLPLKPVALDGEKGDPTPLHAYGASGHQAPKIIRRQDGTQAIECPRCQAQCPIDAVGCSRCGTPFTLEAAPSVRTMSRDTHAAAACALGIVSLITFFLFVPALLAIIFGLLSLRSGFGTGRVRASAVAGIVLGVLSLALGILVYGVF